VFRYKIEMQICVQFIRWILLKETKAKEVKLLDSSVACSPLPAVYSAVKHVKK
jgi:hypothetical protein